MTAKPYPIQSNGLNTERVNSDFTNLYLLAEDGSVYSDAYLKISLEEFPVMNKKKGDDKIIMAFLDNVKYTQLQKECIV